MTQSLTGRALRKRLQNIGVPSTVAAPLAHRVRGLIDSQGPEGAAIYLKRVGDALLHHKYGTPEKPMWVKTVNGFPKFLTGCEDLPEAVLLRLAKLARCIRLSDVSKRQVDKVVSAVVSPYTGTHSGITELSGFISQAIRHLGLRRSKVEFGEFRSPRPIARVFKSVDSVSGKTDNTTSPDLVTAVKLLRNVPELRALPKWEDVFYPVSPATLRRVIGPDQCWDRGHAVGEIHAAQEGGCKLRMFASPYTVVQELLRPIHFWIADNFNKHLPTICTYDQKSGADWAKQKLEAGVTLYSWDLSTATCRFPLEPQVEMLKVLGLPHDYLEALIWACKGEWKVGHELISHFNMREMSWAVGQPLGIVPSMSMFTLAHALLISGIAIAHGRVPEQVFRVLGDDVVISDASVSAVYVEILAKCGVPVSLGKSHQSTEFGEFAGFSISPTSSIRPGQWRNARKANILSLAEEFSSPMIGEMTIEMERIQQYYLFAIGKYSPPPEEWPAHIRVSTMLMINCLDDWQVASAPMWINKAMSEYEVQWSQSFPFLGESDRWSGYNNWLTGKVPIQFVNNEEQPLKVIFRPLREYYDDEVVLSFLQASQLYAWDAYDIVGVNACICATNLWERGVVDSRRASELITEITEAINSLLWLPPKASQTDTIDRLRAIIKSLPHMVV